MVPAAEPRSYYGRPILKAPVWRDDIGYYLFTGGLAGGSSLLGAAAALTGNAPLGRAAERTALVALGVSGGLLVRDLGRPERFLNMLRVFKVSSPMSMGSWLLAGYSAPAAAAAVLGVVGRAPRARAVARLAAGALGAGVATYTAALLADTAVPLWHEGRRELPFLFAAGSLASAGGAAVVLVDPTHAVLPRRAMLSGTAGSLVAGTLLRRRLGDLAEPLRSGTPARLAKAAGGLMVLGAGLSTTLGRTRRPAAVAGGALVLAGALAERMAVFTAGFDSARDPAATVAPQRRRLDASLP